MKKLIAVVCLSLALMVVASPLSAEAGTLDFWPSQFRLSGFGQSMADAETKAMRDFRRLSATGGGCAIYELEVMLPVGTTRINRFAVNASLSGADSLVAELRWMKLGGLVGNNGLVELSGENPHAWYDAPYMGWFPNVRADRKYWVSLNICGSATVQGVRVSYR